MPHLHTVRQRVRTYQGKQVLGTLAHRIAYYFAVLADLAGVPPAQPAYCAGGEPDGTAGGRAARPHVGPQLNGPQGGNWWINLLTDLRFLLYDTYK